MGELTIVVPKHEQSWKGKSMTRYGYLHLEEITLHGEKAYTLDGTPADCINVAIHHVLSEPPDLVVSGINAGINAGVSFIFASGTVGACFEANIAGVPAIAFSQAFDSDTWNKYVGEYALPEDTSKRLRRESQMILKRIFNACLNDDRFLERPITWNVNFPFMLRENFKLSVTPLGISTYGSCFKREDFRFRHDLLDVRRDIRPECDTVLLDQGNVSITPIDIWSLGQGKEPYLDDLRRMFEE